MVCKYRWSTQTQTAVFLCEISFVVCTQMLRVVWGYYPDRHNVMYYC